MSLISSDSWALYSAALAGPRHDYYLTAFKRIDAHRNSWRAWVSWNWAALIGTFIWLRYRKLYAWSWAYLFVSLPAILLAHFFAANTDKCAAALNAHWISWSAVPLILLLLNLSFPLFASRLYFHYVSSRIAAVQRDTNVVDAQIKRLGSSPAVGGCLGPALCLLACLILVLGVVGTYGGNYITRAKVGELILAGTDYRNRISQYFEEHQRIPSGIKELGELTGSSRLVQAIALEADGTVKVTANFSPLQGRSVLLTPSVRDGKLEWACHSRDLPSQCLPASCRR